MNKKIALVKLIRNSFIVPNENKLELLEKIEMMSEEDVEELGQFLAAEHNFIVQNETAIRADVEDVMETMKDWKPPEKVYVGSGRAG